MFEVTILWGNANVNEQTYSFETEAELAAFNLALAEAEANGLEWTVAEIDEALEAEIDEAIADAGLSIVGDDKEVPEVPTETATDEVAV